MMADEPLPWPALLAVLAATPDRLATLVAGATPHALAVAGPGAAWSAAQHIAHMCAVEGPYHARLVRMSLETNPRLATIGSTTGEYDPQTPASILVESFAGLRRNTLAFLTTLSPMAYSRPGEHAELGPVTLRGQVEALARHDESHLAHLVKVLHMEGQ